MASQCTQSFLHLSASWVMPLKHSDPASPSSHHSDDQPMYHSGFSSQQQRPLEVVPPYYGGLQGLQYNYNYPANLSPTMGQVPTMAPVQTPTQVAPMSAVSQVLPPIQPVYQYATSTAASSSRPLLPMPYRSASTGDLLPSAGGSLQANGQYGVGIPANPLSLGGMQMSAMAAASQGFPPISPPLSSPHSVSRRGSTSAKSSLPKKSHSCSICNKVFNRPSGLRIHMHTHTGEKPYKCEWPNCGKRFSVRSNMVRHLKIHKREERKKRS